MSEQQPEPRPALLGGMNAWCRELDDALPPTSGGAPRSGRIDPATLRRDRLCDVIETEIVPRLVLARRAAAAAAAPPARPRAVVRPGDVEAFSRIVLRHEAPAALAQLEQLRRRGLAVETIYLDLLAPVARRLGQLWEEDLCEFTDVTLAVGRLQQVMREYEPLFHDEARGHDRGRCALLAMVPGEQHSFGLSMVVEFFRRAGWDVRTAAGPSVDDLTAQVRSQWFAIVGLSTGCNVRLEALATTVRAIRRASRNRSIGVLVGGAVFIDHPELVTMVGADATAVDARQATVQAQDLLRLLPRAA